MKIGMGGPSLRWIFSFILLALIPPLSVRAQLVAPFTESFDTTSIPFGWSTYNNCNSTYLGATFYFGGTLGYDGSICTDHTGTPGSTYAWVDGSGTIPCRITLESDSIDLGSLTDPYLEFWVFCYNTIPSTGLNTVVINIYDGSKWNDSLLVWSGSSPNWQKLGVDLCSFSSAGKLVIQFQVEKNAVLSDYSDIAFDDISIVNAPPCPEPLQVRVEDVDTTTANIRWIGCGQDHKVVYGPSGFDPKFSGTIDSTTSDSILLNGLIPGINYDAYIFVDCGWGNTSDTLGPYSFSTPCLPLRGGTYTINQGKYNSGTNFSSFNDLADKVNCGGISGPVVVVVDWGTGPYKEQVRFEDFRRIHSSDSILIIGKGQILEYSATDPNKRATVSIVGSKGLHFRNLTIRSLGANTGLGIWITEGAKNISLDSCTVSVQQGNTLNGFSALAVSSTILNPFSEGDCGQYLRFTHNTFEGGFYCVTLNGPSSGAPSLNNVFTKNRVRDFVEYGVCISDQQNGRFNENDISRPNRQNIFSFYGIYASGRLYGTEISGNTLHNVGDKNPNSSDEIHGIHLSDPQGLLNAPFIVSNNVLYNLNMDGPKSGVLIEGYGNHVWILHNTFSFDNAYSVNTYDIRGIDFRSISFGGDLHIKNNIFNISDRSAGIKTVIFMVINFTKFKIDHNQYHLPSPTGMNFCARIGGFGYSDVNTFRSSTNYETNGIQGDPVFLDPQNGDLTPASSIGDNKGLSLINMVPIDFYGVSRNVNNPDPGAIEYSPLSCLPPINVQLDSLTATTASFSWTNDPLSDSVRIEWVPCGWSQGTGYHVFSKGTGVTATGLAPDSCYDFYFVSYCSGVSGNGYLMEPLIRTKCLPQPIPYYEDLSDWVPHCMELLPDSSGLMLWNHYLHSSLWMAEALFGIKGLGSSTMKFPDLTISNRAWVKFSWAHKYDNLNPGDRMLLRVSEVGTSLWDTIWDMNGKAFNSPNANGSSPPLDTSDFIGERIILDSIYSGKDVSLEMIGISGAGNNVYLKGLSVEPIPNCLDPFDISTQGVGLDSAIISWKTISGSGFSLEWGHCGFQQGSGIGTLVTGISSPFTIHGLTSGKCYDVYLKDPCSSNWVGPFSFRTECQGPISGTFTVGGPPGVGNYTNLDSALADLYGCGINGPVIFNIYPGRFNSLEILPIPGSSETNSITLRSVGLYHDTIDGDGTPVALSIMGATHMTLKNFLVTNLNNGWGVWLTGGARDITLDSCRIIVNSSVTHGGVNGIVASQYSNSSNGFDLNAFDVTISNCTIIGGYYGARINGKADSSRVHGFRFINNFWSGQYKYGLYAIFTDSITLIDNHFNWVRGASSYGIFMDGVDHFDIRRNQIEKCSKGIFGRGINSKGNIRTRSSLINNMVHSAAEAVIFENADSLDILHNTIRGGLRGIDFSAGTQGHRIRNNIFVSEGTAPAFRSISKIPSPAIDYNLYYAPKAWPKVQNGRYFSSLSQWKLADTLQNKHSVEGDPWFLGSNDLHVKGILPNNSGDSTLGVQFDIDGDPRSVGGTGQPDMGADEFTPTKWDAEFVSILDSSGFCADSTIPVSVIVRNLGTSTITNLPLSVTVTGDVTATLQKTSFDSIRFLEIDTIFVGNWNAINGGVVNISAKLNLKNDQDPSNDSGSVSGILFIPLDPIAVPVDSFCSTLDTGYLAGYPFDEVTYGWYPNMVDTVPAFVGDTFRFPISGRRTWYMQYEEHQDSLDVFLNMTSNVNNGMMFDLVAKKSVTIDGFTVASYPSYVPVDIKVYVIPNGTYKGNDTIASNWTLHEVVTMITQPVRTRIALTNPIQIPVGDRYAIYLETYTRHYPRSGASTMSDHNLVLESGSPMWQPFSPISEVGLFQGRIHYEAEPCSNNRVGVTLNVDTPFVKANALVSPQAMGSLTGNFDASYSRGATHYWWDFGDGNTGWGMVTSHTYTQGGNYTITLVAINSTCGVRDTLQLQLRRMGVNEDRFDRSLNIYPNPTQGIITVDLEFDGTQDLGIRFMNILGQEVRSYYLRDVSGTFKRSFDLSGQPDGIYLVEIKNNCGIITKRIHLHR